MKIEVVVNAQRVFETGREARARGTLSLWTIYDHPKDYPDTFVARRFELDQPTDDVITGSLDVLRASMAQCGLYCMARDATDDAKIVETWL